MCEGGGARIPRSRCGDDGGKGDESDRAFPQSFVFLSHWTWPLSRCGPGSSRLIVCFYELPLYYELRNPSVLALANADPPPSPSHPIAFVGIAAHLETARTGSANQLHEAGHRHTVESGTATRDVWPLSPTKFYSRSPSPLSLVVGYPKQISYTRVANEHNVGAVIASG
jgi:hypothetical protein